MIIRRLSTEIACDNQDVGKVESSAAMVTTSIEVGVFLELVMNRVFGSNIRIRPDASLFSPA